MAKVYSVAPDHVKAIINRLIKKYHPDVADAGVSVECLYCDAGKDDQDNWKPAVKLHGIPCAGIIKKISVENRTQGMSDTTIILDEHVWEKLSDPERDALIDHELEHIDVQLDEGGMVKTDEAGRPVIKLKPHDWELSGFRAIAERHKDAALEVQELIKFEQSEDGQLVFSFKERG